MRTQKRKSPLPVQRSAQNEYGQDFQIPRFSAGLLGFRHQVLVPRFFGSSLSRPGKVPNPMSKCASTQNGRTAGRLCPTIHLFVIITTDFWSGIRNCNSHAPISSSRSVCSFHNLEIKNLLVLHCVPSRCFAVEMVTRHSNVMDKSSFRI